MTQCPAVSRSLIVLAIAGALSPLLGAAACAHPATSDAALSRLLKEQTQAFSEAGQRSDRATLARYLAPDVVFTNETGEILDREAILANAQGPTTVDPDKQIQVTQWVLRPQGEVATATFVDVLTQLFHGKRLVSRYQSTETWAKRPSGWQIIASHTMVLASDPPAIQLARADLEAYVGLYRLDAQMQVQITLKGDELFSSTNGAAPTPLKAEVRDVLFTPGIPSGRRIVQRGAAGRVTGYISRRNGADILFSRVG